MSRNLKIFGALAVLTAMAVMGGSSAVAAAPLVPKPLLVIDEDDAPDCFEFLPDGTSTAHIGGTPKRVVVDVHVLLDGIELARGQEVFNSATGAYSPLKLGLNVVGFEQVTFPATGEAARLDGEIVPSIASQELIDAAKDHVGGRAPSGADVVYTLTSKEMTDAAGRADCIGGVRYDDMAFAVGIDMAYAEGDAVFLGGYKNATAKIVAHEIGHLLGAHHHYFNCAEAATDDDPSPCTIMSPYVSYASMRFGALEAIVVRGHAEDFASP
ncbi:MAG TPA: zinc-dependent metalloprotease family protein [Actinomycetota bacterium]|nr:zinc-dependent metalloprotease family protein [Actinomycetota bacterium]